MKKWFRHYISPNIIEITNTFIILITVVEFMGWAFNLINHKLIFIFMVAFYLVSIIIDIHHDRLVLQQKINELKENNDGLKQNIDKLISDKNNLQQNLDIQKYIQNIIMQEIPTKSKKLK